MASQLLGQIANPQMADIAGALDYRQKKMQEDEARRKEIKFQQIAGKALSTGLKEGSVLHELAMNDPARYLMVSKALGVDPANGAEGMSLMDDISSIYGHTVQGTENGLGYVQSLIKTRGELGLDTTRLQDLYDQGVENPTIFKNTIDLMQKTFNPNKGASDNIGTYNPRDYTTESWAEFNRTGDPAGLKRYESNQVVKIGGVDYLVDKTTGERTPVSSLQEVTGNVEAVSGAGEKGKLNQQLDIKPKIETAVTSAKDRATSAGDAVDKALSIETGLGVYDKLISEIDNGANTSVFTSWAPSISDATRRFEQGARELGLGVISSTTFGALSEGELKLAMETAVPKLQPAAMKQWLIDKKAAQQKLADQMFKYAEHLENGGTKVSWVKMQKEMKNQGGSGNGSSTTGITETTTSEPSVDDLLRMY